MWDSWKYKSDNKPFARFNRRQRNATRQEGVLWHTFLKRLPVRFFRQYMIEDYIVDFYAPTLKLAIEIDGSQHYEDRNIIYDKQRTEKLNELGITVIRFTNIDIDRKLKQTTEQIEYVIKRLSTDGSI